VNITRHAHVDMNSDEQSCVMLMHSDLTSQSLTALCRPWSWRWLFVYLHPPTRLWTVSQLVTVNVKPYSHELSNGENRESLW